MGGPQADVRLIVGDLMHELDGPWAPDPIRGSSEPGRFWTVTNVAEVTPDLLSPLCWSVWEEPMEFGFRRTMADFGVLSRAEAVFPADRNGRSSSRFFGRQAVNVDLTRQILGRLPGVSGDDFERDILGSVRADAPPDTSAPLRVPLIAAKVLWVALTANRRLQRIHRDNRDWWTREVLERHRRVVADEAAGDATTGRGSDFSDAADAAFTRLVEGREVSEVTGIGASAGRVEGRARVVLDAGEDVELDEGDILVCRITDPSWAPVFGLADALVIDIGGPASHGAVVAPGDGHPLRDRYRQRHRGHSGRSA